MHFFFFFKRALRDGGQTDKGRAWLRSCLYIRLKLYFIFLAKSRFSQMAAKHKLIQIKISTPKSKHAEMRLQASATFRQPARRNTHTTQPGTAPSGVAGSLLSFRSFRNKLSFFPSRLVKLLWWRWQAGSHQTTRTARRIQSISKQTAGSVSLKTEASSNCKADPPRWERRKSKQNCEVNIIGSESTKSGEHVPYLRSCHAAEWDAQDGTKWWSGTLAPRSPCHSPLESRRSRFPPPGSRGWTTVAWRVDSTDSMAVANGAAMRHIVSIHMF